MAQADQDTATLFVQFEEGRLQQAPIIQRRLAALPTPSQTEVGEGAPPTMCLLYQNGVATLISTRSGDLNHLNLKVYPNFDLTFPHAIAVTRALATLHATACATRDNHRAEAEATSNKRRASAKEQGGAASAREHGEATSAREQGEATLAREQDEATSAREQDEATSAREQGEATSAREQGEAASAREHGEAASAREHGEAASAREHGEAASAREHGEAASAREHSDAASARGHGDAASARGHGDAASAREHGEEASYKELDLSVLTVKCPAKISSATRVCLMSSVEPCNGECGDLLTAEITQPHIARSNLSILIDVLKTHNRFPHVVRCLSNIQNDLNTFIRFLKFSSALCRNWVASVGPVSMCDIWISKNEDPNVIGIFLRGGESLRAPPMRDVAWIWLTLLDPAILQIRYTQLCEEYCTAYNVTYYRLTVVDTSTPVQEVMPFAAVIRDLSDSFLHAFFTFIHKFVISDTWALDRNYSAHDRQVRIVEIMEFLIMNGIVGNLFFV